MDLHHHYIIVFDWNVKNFFLQMFRLPKIKEWIDTRDPNAIIIPFSGALELKV